MIKHLVWWTLKDEAEGNTAIENARIMKEKLERQKGLVPSLKNMEVSTHFLASTTEHVQILMQTTHEDIAGLKAYAEDPEHKSCVEFIRKVVATRKAIDFVVE